MKALACVKRVIDYNVRIQLQRDGSGVVTDGVKMSMNPFDEIAVEEGLRLKEKGHVEELIVITIGGAEAQQQLRTALAMGADRAILIECDESLTPLATAKVLLKIVEREQPGLVMLGKQAIDDDRSQTGEMLAALWDRPQATYASGIEFGDGHLMVTREVDAGLEQLEVDLPAVVTVDLRLNEPRFVKMPDIMKAKRKPLETVALADLGAAPGPAVTVSDYQSPPTRSAGKRVEDVAGLVEALKERGLV